MPALFDLTGRVSWVVGGAGLLGTAVSQALAEQGATVVVADASGERAEHTAESLRSNGFTADAQTLDLSDAAAVDTNVAAIIERHGRLDHCVNLAAIHAGVPYAEVTPEALARSWEVNLTGAITLSRAAARAMAETGDGGRIVHFASMYGVVSPDPAIYGELPVNPVDYGVAKAGILQLTRWQAVNLAADGVLVNAVIPGPFPNPEGQGAVADFVDRLAAKVPLGRVGRAEEIAGAVVYLCSPAASFTTGTSITVDGGWTAW